MTVSLPTSSRIVYHYIFFSSLPLSFVFFVFLHSCFSFACIRIDQVALHLAAWADMLWCCCVGSIRIVRSIASHWTIRSLKLTLTAIATITTASARAVAIHTCAGLVVASAMFHVVAVGSSVSRSRWCTATFLADLQLNIELLSLWVSQDWIEDWLQHRVGGKDGISTEKIKKCLISTHSRLLKLDSAGGILECNEAVVGHWPIVAVLLLRLIVNPQVNDLAKHREHATQLLFGRACWQIS